MLAFIKSIFLMLFAYWLATGSIFVVLNDAPLSTSKLVDGFVVFGIMSLMSFWFYLFVPSISWILLRSRPSIAVTFTIMVCLTWAIVTSSLESFQVRPGLFGRAIENGEPTKHYFIDAMVVAVCTIAIFELIKFPFKKRGGELDAK